MDGEKMKSPLGFALPRWRFWLGRAPVQDTNQIRGKPEMNSAQQKHMSFAGSTLRLIAGVAVIAAALGGCQSLDRKNKPKAATKEVAQAREQAKVVNKQAQGVATPPTAVGSTEKGAALLEEGLYKEAVVQFEKAIADNPLFAPAFLGAGNAHYKLDNKPAAEKNFGRAAQLEPGNFDAQFMHGVVLQELNKYDQAIRAFNRALEIKPADFAANLNLGTAYLQVEEPQEALPFVQKAVEIKPEDGVARTNLGAVYAALNKHEEAITEWNQASELMKLSPKLLLNMADSYNRLQQWDEMVSTLDEVVKLEPSATAYERLGAGLFRQKQYDQALEAFVRAVELDANHFPAHNGVGVTLLHRWLSSGQQDTAAHNDAMRALRKSLQLEKNQPRVLELLTRYKD
jgi:tetratricopeptide (TPR) repeat protein